MLFPGATSESDLADVVNRFANHTYWDVVDIENKDAEDPGYINLGLRWPVPRSRYVSEVLGFADLDCMPFTRRSPVTAMALRTHAPAKAEKDGRVHLAQMPFFEIEERKREYFWEKTQTEKADLLTDELVHAARARISCRLPVNVWRKTTETVL